MTLLDTLFGGQRQRALGWLLLHPDNAVHVRELARLTGTSAGSLHRELARLADAGLLQRNTRGNQVLYQANRSCPVFAELSGLFRKTGGLADVLRQALAPLEPQIEHALIFGSVARGEETALSDIDVLVIGRASFTDVVSALYECQSTLGREINPVVYSTEEWHARQEQGDHFVRDILSRPTLLLIGALDDAGQFIGHPQTGSPGTG
ncbi:MAG: nucleotidyltransferase domain-containing protein [Paludibacterium sp.]|uniref:MarR family transcriptional regulator n=1 Tax=Paludibacterium sp. TaxID=1917523 RepID=UPI0025EC50AF|nr:MarR family transcriptional regulator [Paludibacterium sp.]MBV8046281.1 nucleotidyltransferase domain-containing protein [Paludibacterium sp.]MBV8648044.1 nucleotidyltransferase domain-containing protein [Paludibacterium sp.]